MIDACTHAVQRGGCVLASATPENARPESVAVVVWQAELLHVSVRVSRGDGAWVSRQIAFSAADEIGDRWTAVGLTVATLLDETQPASAPKQDAAPSPLLVPPPTEVPARTRLALDLGALTGTAWQGGEWQRGLWATVSATLPRTPLFALAGFSYAWSDGPNLASAGALSSDWLGVSLGAGIEGTIGARVRLFAAPEIALQLVSAKLPAIGGTLHDREWRLRLRGGAV